MEKKQTVRPHPAPPTALIQEIPTPDIVHTFEQPPKAQNEAETLRRQNNGPIFSDVNGSYTGTAADGGTPEQDADDL